MKRFFLKEHLQPWIAYIQYIWQVFERYWVNSQFQLQPPIWWMSSFLLSKNNCSHAKFTMLLHNKSGSKEISSLIIVIPPWFQKCIYWMKSVIWLHLLESFIFSIIVLLLHGCTWSDPYFKDTVSISQHLLQPSVLLQAVCDLFEKNIMICLFEESHCSPALLNVRIYS